MKTFEGNLVAQNMKVALVAARFNEFITSKLIGGALALIAALTTIVLMGLAFDAGGFSWPEIWADFFDSLTDNSMFF